MKPQLAVILTVVALAACQGDMATQETAREADEVELTAGQVLDCSGALTEAARIVCSDSDLRALDRRIAELWAEVSVETGRPATMAWRHEEWTRSRDAGEREWETGRDRPRTQEELLAFYQAYADSLTEELRQARALPETVSVSALSGGCIGTVLEGCQAPAAGFLNGPDGQRLAWQLQQGSTTYAGYSAGVVLFRVENETLTPVGWTFDGAEFQRPSLFRVDGATYIAATGTQMGTASENADVLFRLDGRQWSEIEVESWKSALEARLPDGLGVWKGVHYEWPQMAAESLLWRESDANCCGTGGSVEMAFDVQDRSLRLESLSVEQSDG